MPPFVVLVVCKVAFLPYATPLDEYNSKYTHYQPYTWDTTDSVMHCRREQIQVFDPSVSQGADPQPFNQFQCRRAGILAGLGWDALHKNWKTWRTACPTPIVDTRTGKTIGWKMPECGGESGTVICEKDSSI